MQGVTKKPENTELISVLLILNFLERHQERPYLKSIV